MKGKVVAIQGDVLDLEFEGIPPEINDAVIIKKTDGSEVILEVREHRDKKTVSAVSLGFTHGLERGLPVHSTVGPLKIPVGTSLLGRVLNIFGSPIDGGEVIQAPALNSVHRMSPALKDLTPISGILETGIKIIDLLAPFPKGYGDELLGRVIDPLGNPLDGSPAPAGLVNYNIEREAPPLIKREYVSRPLYTGIKAVDAMLPIGRGQRELIIGDPSTGKTSIAVAAVASQKGSDLISIYACIGQKKGQVWKGRWKT